MAGARIIEWVAELFEKAVFKDAEKDLSAAVGKDAEKNLGEGWTKAGLSLDAEANAEVDSYLGYAHSMEPKITGDMTEMSRSVPGSELTGLEFRLKEADSLKRKVATDLMEQPNLSPAEALAEVKDSIRYTMKIPGDGYADGVSAAVGGLRAKGYERVSWKTFWASDGYKGINSAWRDPVTGQVFEVQFHTPESFDAKMEAHPLYEQTRVPGISVDGKLNLIHQQKEIFSRVPIPPGVSRLMPP